MGKRKFLYLDVVEKGTFVLCQCKSGAYRLFQVGGKKRSSLSLKLDIDHDGSYTSFNVTYLPAQTTLYKELIGKCCDDLIYDVHSHQYEYSARDMTIVSILQIKEL